MIGHTVIFSIVQRVIHLPIDCCSFLDGLDKMTVELMETVQCPVAVEFESNEKTTKCNVMCIIVLVLLMSLYSFSNELLQTGVTVNAFSND